MARAVLIIFFGTILLHFRPTYSFRFNQNYHGEIDENYTPFREINPKTIETTAPQVRTDGMETDIGISGTKNKVTIMHLFALIASAENSSVSPACQRQLLAVADAICDNDKTWPNLFLESQFTSSSLLGDYEMCMNISTLNIKTDTTASFLGRYCRIGVNLKQYEMDDTIIGASPFVYLGVCVPNTCTEEEAVHLVDGVLKLSNSATDAQKSLFGCKDVLTVMDEESFTPQAVVSLYVIGSIGVLMVFATVYDVVFVRGHFKFLYQKKSKSRLLLVNPDKQYEQHQYIPGLLGEIFLAFSIYTNGKRILSTTSSPEQLRVLHGMRFISMTWVILGNTFLYATYMMENIERFKWWSTEWWTFQIVENTPLASDSFFCISGVIVTFLTLKRMQNTNGKLNWLLFFIYRYCRITIPYALFMVFYIPLLQYFSDGPFWPEKGIERDYCRNTWWKNLLYINNFVDVKNPCMSWSWYLTLNMQFYVLSPLILLPLNYYPKLGGAIIGMFLLTTIVATGFVSKVYGLSTSMFRASHGNYFQDYFIKPYCRIGPYLCGMVAGYFLYKTDFKVKIKWYTNLICWMVAVAVGLAVAYGLYRDARGNTLSTDVAAAYNAFHRTAWGAAVAWVIFACATGNGGFVNTILSWTAFVPASKMTFAAYLSGPLVARVHYLDRHTLFYATDVQMIHDFLGTLCLSYMVAFVVTITYEAPTLSLQRIIFRRSSMK